MKGCHAKGTSTKGGFEHVQQSRKSHSPQLTTHLPSQGQPCRTMVTIDGDEVFYNCAESFTIWETFWLCVWSFSMFPSSLCTICCKVYNLVQTLVETQLIQSYKKATASYHIANLNLTQKPNERVCTQNPFLETCLETKCTLLPPFPNSIILAHIFILLSLASQCFGDFVE